jgi:hypothetical protein
MIHPLFFNYLLYQIGWFACVLGGAFARPWLGAALALILVSVHLWLAKDRLGEMMIMAVAVAVGLLVDTLLLAAGVFTFPSGIMVSWLPPLWMTVLWLQFATTFRYCLHWLSGRYLLCLLLGLFGAPLAFLGGESLGAVTFFPPRPIHFLMLGVVWCLAIPSLIYASDRLHATRPLPASYRGIRS